MNRNQLVKQIFEKNSFLCVGLDPDVNKMPVHLAESADDPIFQFNKSIIDATAPYCVAFKPNLAFYECHGLKGIEAFEHTVRYIKKYYPNHFVIADAKRGDIGNTSTMYARTFFEQYDVDAITVAPYMGADSVLPFLEYKNKWVILLALTSNKGSEDFQQFTDNNGIRLFEKVIDRSLDWGYSDNLMFVVGATQGKKFADIRKHAPNNFLLVHGVGAQGGDLHEVCKFGMTKDCGLLVNSSRAIIYASKQKDFADAAAAAAEHVQEQMRIELESLNG